MRLVPLGLLLLAQLSAQPSQSDRYKFAPLVSAAKLWNLIRYLHPRLTGDSTNWDSALLAALPKIEAAHSDEDLAQALDDMLKTLHDPCTRIALGLPGPAISVQAFDSDTMVIRSGNGDLSGSMGAGLMLQMGIPQTHNLVWDLRGSRAAFTRVDISRLGPGGLGYAFRQHSGYPPQDGSLEHYYSSSLQIVEPRLVTGAGTASSKRQIYLIDKDSAVPVQAIIDQINSRSAILSEDPPGSLQAGYTETVTVLGKVAAEVRLADLYYSDGTTEFAPTRVVLNRGQEAVKAAVDAVESGTWGEPGARPGFKLRPSAFHDVPYSDNPYPGREMRMLAAFRIWGIMHYFNPVVTALGAKWDDALVELLPKFSEAKNALEYHQAIAELAARTADPSCLTGSPELTTIFGPAAPSFEMRRVEGQLAVTHIFKPGSAQVGDVILKIDGVTVESRAAKLSPYLPVPAPQALDSGVARFLLTGPADGTLKLTVRGKDNAEREITVPIDEANLKTRRAHREGDAVRLISEKIGYADLERIEPAGVDNMFEKLRDTTAIILDLRGYPRNIATAVAGRLGKRNQPLVAELQRNLVGIGLNSSHISALQTDFRISSSSNPRYLGKTVALLDGVSLNIAAEIAMCFKAANDTVLIGSMAFPTFSGHATVFDVPGGAKIYFSGQSARWPDGTALRQGGVQPDLEVVPTLAGIREGRDEVLDKAIAYLSSSSK